jgi:hypothetical protein
MVAFSKFAQDANYIKEESSAKELSIEESSAKELSIEENTNEMKITKDFPSICIPRTLGHINRRWVWKVFMQLNLGEIERIDWRVQYRDSTKWVTIPLNTKPESYTFQVCQFFIHFKAWNINSMEAVEIRERLLSVPDEGQKMPNIKVVYDDPWYWQCFASRIPKPKIR